MKRLVVIGQGLAVLAVLVYVVASIMRSNAEGSYVETRSLTDTCRELTSIMAGSPDNRTDRMFELTATAHESIFEDLLAVVVFDKKDPALPETSESDRAKRDAAMASIGQTCGRRF